MPCGSPGFPSGVVVTVVFTPPHATPGSVNVVVLATDCSRVGACAGAEFGRTTCVTVNDTSSIDLQVVDGQHLRFRFPDTAEFFPGATDDPALTGSATIAVTAPDAPVLCGLATTSCASATGLLGCADAFFADDGSCDHDAGADLFPFHGAAAPEQLPGLVHGSRATVHGSGAGPPIHGGRGWQRADPDGLARGAGQP